MIAKLSVLLLLPTMGFCNDLSEVERYVQQVDQLRQTLVKGVSGKPTKQTFRQVCSPVGLNIKRIAKEKNIKIRQASHKPRNSKHVANNDEIFAIDLFKKRSDIKSIWLDINGERHFFRKIIVQKACLSCHGDKNKRPDFIKDKYPGDKAFNFKVGDVRGVYHVKSK